MSHPEKRQTPWWMEKSPWKLVARTKGTIRLLERKKPASPWTTCPWAQGAESHCGSLAFNLPTCHTSGRSDLDRQPFRFGKHLLVGIKGQKLLRAQVQGIGNVQDIRQTMPFDLRVSFAQFLCRLVHRGPVHMRYLQHFRAQVGLPCTGGSQICAVRGRWADTLFRYQMRGGSCFWGRTCSRVAALRTPPSPFFPFLGSWSPPQTFLR